MPGIFILSLDTEIAWGTLDKRGLIKHRRDFNNYRRNIDRLIELLEKYQIKATWAFVGHLFLNRCDAIHPDVFSVKYSQQNDDRRFYSLGTDINKYPFWYGKDILEKVKRISPSQEIGTHTFSHIAIWNKTCTKEIAYSQIKKCLDLAEKEDICIKSIVFPWNKIGYLDVLKDLGIEVFRGLESDSYQNFPINIKRLFHFLDHILVKMPPVYSVKDLINHSGVLEIPASMFLMPYDGGIRNLIPSYSRFVRTKKGLERAVSKNSIFHLWFHPFNLGSSEKMFRDLENILQLAKTYIDSEKIINMTMVETANFYRKNYAD